jgi:hypothetical protein
VIPGDSVPFGRPSVTAVSVALIEAAKIAPLWNSQLAAVHERELKKGNRNRATLAVARRMVAYMMAVDKNQVDFIVHKEEKAA